MSENELVKRPDNFLDMYDGTSSDDDWGDVESDANIESLSPKIKLQKGAKEDAACTIQVLIGGEPVLQEQDLVFCLIGSYGSRLLWPPDESDEVRPPQCFTGLVSVSDMKNERCSGKWLEEEGRSEQPCKGCEWNEFGSEAEWRSKEGSKGKACKEQRVFYVALLKPFQQVGKVPSGPRKDAPIYNYAHDDRFAIPGVNPYGLVKINISLSSSRPMTEYVSTTLTGMKGRVAGKCCVAFGLTGTTMKAGTNLYASFQAVQVGLLVGKPAADYPILRDAGVWLKEYLDEKGDEEALDQNPVEKKEEIPF